MTETATETGRWKTLERWSPPAFTIGGLGILSLSIVGTLDVAAVIPSPAWVHAVLMLGGLWFAFLGLLGLYPSVAESAPRLSLGGVVTSALGGVALTVGVAGSIAVALTTQQTFGEGPAWGPPLLALAFIFMLLSFLFYGATSLRTGIPSRTVGLLLLIPVVAFLGQSLFLLTKIFADVVLAGAQLAVAGLTGIALITVGYRLQTESEPTDHAEPVPTETEYD